MIPRYLYSQFLHTYFESCPARPSFFFSCCCCCYYSVYYIPWQGQRYSVSQRLRIVDMVYYDYLGKVLVVVYEETTCKRHPTTVLMHPMPRMISAGRVR